MSTSIFSYEHLNILLCEVSVHVRFKFVLHRFFYCRIKRAARQVMRLTARDPEDEKELCISSNPAFASFQQQE